MTTIEVMLKAIRQAITVMENDTPNSDVLDLCYKSLSEGEAELRREPDAHMYPSDLQEFQERETFAHAYSVAVGCPGETSVPLYTREEIK